MSTIFIAVLVVASLKVAIVTVVMIAVTLGPVLLVRLSTRGRPRGR
ncbi:hypothetical protein [Planomonospora sp. ID82291]|nr:hypothetical protein [Planomonospora sp. ID82291]MBG0818606.1 hypothetical protein [Planomonospora sp. ID82291]